MSRIIAEAHPVKYHDIKYEDSYVLISQNRTRRRVYNGYYFEDTGTHIYVSVFCANMFQHKNAIRKFWLDTETKEWEDYSHTVVEKHYPDKKEVEISNIINELKK